MLFSAPNFSRLFAALHFHKNRVTPFWHQTLQFTVYTSCYNSNMHGCWRSINLNAFKRILVNKRTIHYDVTTQNFFIRRPPQSRHSSPNLPSLSIYQYVRFLAKTNLDSGIPLECVYAVRVGRSTKEFVVSNLVTSNPTKSHDRELLFQLSY